MRFDVVTLFPEMFTVVRDLGVTGRAHAQGIWQLNAWNPRDFTRDVHRTVDDRPYGGGPGMVMMAGPLTDTVRHVQADRAASALVPAPALVPVPIPASARASAPVILLSPTGRQFDQKTAAQLAQSSGAILICGRYEGVDQRFIETIVTDEISIGDFVLSGGEIGAMAILDATVRLMPGVLNDSDSARQDSFADQLTGLLDSPHYTRPETYGELVVPQTLLSGHHVNIARWRREQSLRLTALRRPDLIEQARKQRLLSKEDEIFLAQLSRL
jgi:tRNA (guanine37-N1)-methyltransferase